MDTNTRTLFIVTVIALLGLMLILVLDNVQIKAINHRCYNAYNEQEKYYNELCKINTNDINDEVFIIDFNNRFNNNTYN